jgi:UDP-GlcNAc:undecaprenyl-phosphate/decaprenyl-phosphate GlcNAc-1-phosphate transferase
MMPLAKAASFRFGILANPSWDRPHLTPTALLGGLAVIAGLVVTIGLVGILSGLPHHSIPWLAGFAVTMCVVGLIDDIVDLRPRTKFMLELAAICLVVWSGTRLDFFPYEPLNVALTIFWLATATNAFNLIDGVDGLAAGVGILAALSIAVVAGLHQHTGTMLVSLALAGSLAGFMIFNFPPASVFMGDEGALAIGLVLGVLSIQGSRFGDGSLPARVAMPLLALMVPLLDTVTVTVTRLATGNPISKRGLDHSHHRLSRMGLSSSTAAGILIGLQFIAGVCAIALSLVPGYDAVLLLPFMALFFALVALFLMDRSFDVEAPGKIEDLPPIARVILSFGYKRRFVELILDVALVAAAYFGAVLLRFDFNLDITQVSQMLAGLPCIVAIGCGAFFVTGVYRGIWRYTGLAEGVRFMVAAMLAGLAVKLASSFLPIYLGRAATLMFVLLLFNLLVATRWSFHLFQRIGRSLAHSAKRFVIVGADARGAAAVQHLHSTTGGGMELLGVVDDDSFKHGKLFHGYPVLGAVNQLYEIMARTPFDEIVIAQETLSATQLASLESFASSNRIALRRFWLGLTDLSASAIPDQEFRTASAR